MECKSTSTMADFTRRAVLAGAAASMAARPALAQSAEERFLQGREKFTYGTTWAENLEAQTLLQEALTLDASLASAKAYLSQSYIREWRHNWWSKSEQESLDQAIAAAQEAVQLKDDNADAHTAMGIVHLVQGAFGDAKKEYDRALGLNSADADIIAEVGFAQIYMGERAAGIEKIEQARNAKPAHPWWYESVLAWGYYQDRRYGDAVAVLTAMDPIVNDVRMILAASHARLGQMQEAQDVMALFRQNETWTIADEMGAAFVSAEDEQHWLDGLRMAGMDEGSGKTPQPPPQ